MRVLIDLTQVRVEKAGVGIYAEQLLKNLVIQNSGNFYFALVQDDDPALDLSESEHVRTLKIPATLFRKLFLRFWIEQIYIPYLTVRYRIEVVHSLHYSFPLLCFWAKRVVTIHDMTMFLFPRAHQMVKPFYFRFFITAAANLADRLVFDSYSSLHDFEHQFKVETRKLRVVHLGKSEAFTPQSDPALLQAIRSRYGIKARYILFIGTLEPRKNIPSLIRAFSRLIQDGTPLQLVIAGGKGWLFDEIFQLTSQLRLESKVVFTGYIDESEKPALLAGAEMFVYPSLYEGFGIPVLEALSSGAPTITSNVSSMPEVAGDAAILIDPSDVDQLYVAMRRILDDAALRDRLRRLATEQASKFSWQKTAAETAEIYST